MPESIWGSVTSVVECICADEEQELKQYVNKSRIAGKISFLRIIISLEKVSRLAADKHRFTVGRTNSIIPVRK